MVQEPEVAPVDLHDLRRPSDGRGHGAGHGRVGTDHLVHWPDLDQDRAADVRGGESGMKWRQALLVSREWRNSPNPCRTDRHTQ